MRALPLVFSLLLGVPALAATTPQTITPPESRTEAQKLVADGIREGKIMPPSEAKRGMRGYGLSVFQGTKIEKFNIEVLGTLEKVQGGGDLVMIRVLDGPVVTRQSGIIQGMSGSPVYINGKLLGAIAIGFGFPKEPIGGVTPITQMISTALPDTTPRPKDVKLAKKTEVWRPTSTLNIAGRKVARVEVSLDATKSPFAGSMEAATMRMRPCTRLLMMSGIAPGNLDNWKHLFEPYGFTPVLGGGGMSNRQVFGPSSKKTGVHATLEPGAAIGVQLASGDVDATGVGTVTYRLGNRVLAFGHPMFGLGAVSMPMTTAYIHDLFPSYDTSFKLASPLDVVGELEEDTVYAIGGTVGRQAQTIPMRLHLIDASKKIDRKFNSRLIQDPIFTPQLATQVATEAAQDTFGLDSDKMVQLTTEIKLRGEPTIMRHNTLYAGESVFSTSLSDFLEALSLTQQNPYEKGALQEINVRAEVTGSRKTAEIRRLLADRNRVKAGDTINLSVVLAPHNEPDRLITRHFTVKVPDDAPDGALRIAVSPADAFWTARGRVGGAPPNPGTLKELLQAYGRIGAADTLLLQVSTPRRFLLVDRKKVVNPPASWNRLVPAGNASSIGMFNETLEDRQDSGYVLDGMETLVLPVDSKRQTDREAPENATAATTTTDTATPDANDATDATGDVPVATLDEGNDEPTVLATRALHAPLSHGDALTMSDYTARWKAKVGWSSLYLQTKPRLRDARGRTNVELAPTPTPIPTPTPMPTPDAAAANIARPAGRWVQNTATDFRRGEFFGTIARDDGTLVVGPKSTLVNSTGEALGWSVAVKADGTVYLGTGNNARLYEVKNGESNVIYEGPEVAITALAVGPDGDLYAGASPGGRIYRFKSDGTHSTVLQADTTFIHALVFDKDGNLWVGAGGETGAIYRLAAASLGELNDKPDPFVTTDAHHVRSLAVDGNTIYAGTADDANLLRITSDADGKAHLETLYESHMAQALGDAATQNAASLAAQATALLTGAPLAPPTPQSNEVSGVAALKGAVYFGTLAGGILYKWSPSGGVQEALKTNARSIYSVCASADGNSLWIGTGERGELWRAVVNADGTLSGARALDADQNEVLSLTPGTGNEMYAATANNAAIYKLGDNGTATPTYLSNVFDAGQIVRWGVLRSLGSGVGLETRSGNTIEPDATWSDFTPIDATSKIVSPPARYLQYRATLSGDAQLDRVEAIYRAPNRAPVVTWTLPAGGEYFSGKKTVSWNGTDPDGDSLRYTLEISVLKGTNWQKVDLKNATQTSQELDTTKYGDGIYQLRVTASDAARNPETPMSDSRISLPFTIDNALPVLKDVQLTAGDGGTWRLTANGNDGTSPLAGAEWRILPPQPVKTADKAAKPADATATPLPTTPSAWVALAAQDGIFDSTSETIVGTLDATATALNLPLTSGSRIEIRLRDAAGNAVVVTQTLP